MRIGLGTPDVEGAAERIVRLSEGKTSLKQAQKIVVQIMKNLEIEVGRMGRGPSGLKSDIEEFARAVQDLLNEECFVEMRFGVSYCRTTVWRAAQNKFAPRQKQKTSDGKIWQIVGTFTSIGKFLYNQSEYIITLGAGIALVSNYVTPLSTIQILSSLVYVASSAYQMVAKDLHEAGRAVVVDSYQFFKRAMPIAFETIIRNFAIAFRQTFSEIPKAPFAASFGFSLVLVGAVARYLPYYELLELAMLLFVKRVYPNMYPGYGEDRIPFMLNMSYILRAIDATCVVLSVEVLAASVVRFKGTKPNYWLELTDNPALACKYTDIPKRAWTYTFAYEQDFRRRYLDLTETLKTRDVLGKPLVVLPKSYRCLLPHEMHWAIVEIGSGDKDHCSAEKLFKELRRLKPYFVLIFHRDLFPRIRTANSLFIDVDTILEKVDARLWDPLGVRIETRDSEFFNLRYLSTALQNQFKGLTPRTDASIIPRLRQVRIDLQRKVNETVLVRFDTLVAAWIWFSIVYTSDAATNELQWTEDQQHRELSEWMGDLRTYVVNRLAEIRGLTRETASLSG